MWYFSGNPPCRFAAGTRKDENLSGIHPRTKAEDFSELDSESSEGAVIGFRLPPEWEKDHFRSQSPMLVDTSATKHENMILRIYR